MLEAARKARAKAAGREREDLDQDEDLSLVLQRLIEIIGEAAKNVTPQTRAQATGIRWPAIAGMRDRLIHAYFDVNLDILWTTVTDDLPQLISALELLLTTDSPT